MDDNEQGKQQSEHATTSEAESSKPNDLKKAKRISLVLGAGGARGLAHIGVIRELLARNYKIEGIAGCSIGALIGGLYALDKMEDYAEWVEGLDKKDVFRLVDLTNTPGGFIAGKRLMKQLQTWIGDAVIEDLPIKYTAVAVDINREREIWFNQGSLYDAIRASISIPGIFTPHQYKGLTLVDGSLLNPIPVAPTVSQLTEEVFVVSANGPEQDLKPYQEKPDKDESDSDELDLLDKTLNKIGFGSKEKDDIERKMDVSRVMMLSLDTMQGALTRQHLAVFQPDRVFHIPRNLCMIHEFYRAKEIISAGHKIASEMLDETDKTSGSS